MPRFFFGCHSAFSDLENAEKAEKLKKLFFFERTFYTANTCNKQWHFSENPSFHEISSLKPKRCSITNSDDIFLNLLTISGLWIILGTQSQHSQASGVYPPLTILLNYE